MKKEVVDFLYAHPIGCLATVENGAPKVRPWGFMLEEDGKLWFCTANNKNVYQQLKANPKVEFAVWENYDILRISGEVKFSSDVAMKEKILEKNPGLKPIYENGQNPIFEIFYLDHGVATLLGNTYEF